MWGFVTSFALDHWTWLLGGIGGTGLLACIPVIGPILAFLKANWKWVLPLLVIIGLGIWIVFLKFEVSAAELKVANYVAADAEANAKAETQVNNFDHAVSDDSNKLLTQQAAQIGVLVQQRDSLNAQLLLAQSSTVCLGSPAGAAFFRSRMQYVPAAPAVPANVGGAPSTSRAGSGLPGSAGSAAQPKGR